MNGAARHLQWLHRWHRQAGRRAADKWAHAIYSSPAADRLTGPSHHVHQPCHHRCLSGAATGREGEGPDFHTREQGNANPQSRVGGERGNRAKRSEGRRGPGRKADGRWARPSRFGGRGSLRALEESISDSYAQRLNERAPTAPKQPKHHNKNPQEMSRVKASIEECRTVEDLVQLAHGHLDDLPPNIASLFWKNLSALLGKPVNRHVRVDYDTMGYQLDALFRHTTNEMEAFPPSLLSNVAQSVALVVKKADSRGRRPDHRQRMLHDIFVKNGLPFWDKVQDQATAQIDSFRPKFLVSIAWSFATILDPVTHSSGNALDVSPFFHSLHGTFDRRRVEFSSKHIGNLAWSSMSCRQNAPQLLEAFSAEFVRRRKQEQSDGAGGHEGQPSAKDSVDPKTLCQWANAYAKARHRDPELFRSIAQAAIPLLWEFNARHFANLAHALSVAETVPMLEDGSSFFDELAAAAVPRAPTFDAQNMANMLWAYAKMEHPAPELFEAVATVAFPRLNEFSSRQLANLAWSMSKLPPSSWEQVFDSIAEEVVARGLDSFAPQGLAMLSHSFATVGHTTSDEFWDCLDRAVAARCSELGPIECSQIAWSFATIGRPSDELFLGIESSAMLKMDYIKPQGLSNLAWSFAVLGYYSSHFFEAIAQQSLQKLDEFTPRDKSMLVLAYSRITPSFPELFDGVARGSLSHLDKFTGLDLFNMVVSYAKMGQQSGPLMNAIADEIVRRPSHFPPELLVGIAWAYASVDCRVPALFNSIAGECIKHCDGLKSKELASLAWSFASLEYFHRPLLGALAVSSEGRWHDFDAPSLANMAWAYATAREDRPTLLEEIAMAAINRKDELTPQSISMLLWACSDLGYFDERLFDSFAPIAASLLHECNCQELTTIAWAYAVANIEADPLFGAQSTFLSTLAEKFDELDEKGLSQLHQWNAWKMEVTGERALPTHLGQRCYEAFIKQPLRQSNMQKDVMSELISMGLDPEEESLTASGYYLDALVDVNGKKIGVEVDGPHHFVGRRPTGSTTLKHRQVSVLDEIPFVSLPYWELNEVESSDDRQQYLRTKLDLK